MGLAELVLGTAPIAAGALFGAVTGNFKGPDVRTTIMRDMDLLERLSADDRGRRDRLRALVDRRVDDLLSSEERAIQLQESAQLYQGISRDLLVMLGTVVFVVVWWYVPHTHAHWIITFVVLCGLTLAAAIQVARAAAHAVRKRVNVTPAG
ncbi:MAG: hypothetical protein HOQ24_05655 [Mycobacteriaceae bacterium]|nr:hypothetical protein [Mycobacteriaceae bacterium]